MGVQATLNPVLRIPELLQLIISSLPGRSDYYRASLVCHTWNEFGLNALWSRLRSLQPLLNLIAPLVEIDGRLTWDRVALAERGHTIDWDRVLSYAKRIRHIYVNAERVYHPSVWTEIEAWKPVPSLLPNLREVECSQVWLRDIDDPNPAPDEDHILSLLLFVFGPKVTHFTWRASPGHPFDALDDMDGLDKIIAAAIIRRRPPLQRARFGPTSTEDLARALPKLPQLARIEMYIRNLDAQILSALSSLPDLEELDISVKDSVTGPVVGPTHWPKLETLRLDADHVVWLKMFDGQKVYGTVKKIYGSTSFPTGIRIGARYPTQVILGRLISSLPNITHLGLDIFESRSDTPNANATPSPVLLRGLGSLQSIDLRLPYSVYVAHDEVTYFLQSAPNLKSFQVRNGTKRLSTQPEKIPPEGWLPLTVLDEFSRHCPMIELIAIQCSNENPMDSDTKEDCSSLQHLQALALVGQGVIDAHAASIYLSKKATRATNVFVETTRKSTWVRVPDCIRLIFRYEETQAK